jgi:hypothetical protein
VSDKFVRRWCSRAGNQRFDRVDWSNHRKERKKTHNRTSLQVERCIVRTRKYLHDKSVLGEYGAQAIYREMQSQKCPFIPSLWTINLVLKRQGCIEGKSRLRYASPPPGWYLPDVARGEAELDSFDYIEDLRLEGDNGFVNGCNGISLHGGLVCSFPLMMMSAENTVTSMLEHWRQFGVPTYAQFDNSTVFTGPRKQKISDMCVQVPGLAAVTSLDFDYTNIVLSDYDLDKLSGNPVTKSVLGVMKVLTEGNPKRMSQALAPIANLDDDKEKQYCCSTFVDFIY